MNLGFDIRELPAPLIREEPAITDGFTATTTERPLAQGGRMSPTPTLIRQVAANGGISISVNGIARPLDEANCRLTRELVGRIGESDDPELASFAQLVDTLRSSALSALGPFELENAAWCASVLGAES